MNGRIPGTRPGTSAARTLLGGVAGVRSSAARETLFTRLVRGIHWPQHGDMKEGWVYIMTNRPNGTLYLGVTSDIVRRAWEHREGAG